MAAVERRDGNQVEHTQHDVKECNVQQHVGGQCASGVPGNEMNNIEQQYHYHGYEVCLVTAAKASPVSRSHSNA